MVFSFGFFSSLKNLTTDDGCYRRKTIRRSTRHASESSDPVPLPSNLLPPSDRGFFSVYLSVMAVFVFSCPFLSGLETSNIVGRGRGRVFREFDHHKGSFPLQLRFSSSFRPHNSLPVRKHGGIQIPLGKLASHSATQPRRGTSDTESDLCV